MEMGSSRLGEEQGISLPSKYILTNMVIIQHGIPES